MSQSVNVQKPTNWTGIALKMLAIFAMVILTNFGFFDRVKLLLLTERWFTLVFYLGIWGVSMAALIIAAFQPNKTVRLAWGFILSVSVATGFLYSSVSGSVLSVFDALSLWTAKHEASRAFALYKTGALWSLMVFAACFVVFAAPPVPNNHRIQFGLKWLPWIPAFPVLLIAAIVLIKEGGGSQAMPSQFQPLAVGMVSAYKVATNAPVKRRKVTLVADQSRPVKHIVMLVDESIRPDYFNWKPGNPYTPNLARLRSRLVDFGNAVSGGNCSSYSNAILRFGATPDDIVKSSTTNPTIWSYAKKAGFRTVFIDGQSGVNKDPGLLQNFMTVGETANIDEIVRFTGVPSPQLDFKLLEIIEKELKSDHPVFIYANKNGAHFPYDDGYPVNRVLFAPTVSEVGEDRLDTRVNSYFNVINWSVDRFFAKLFDNIDLNQTAIIYTSDHGQAVFNGRLPHCSIDDPDLREGLVPLFAITGNQSLKEKFARGAALNKAAASHFLIRPTVLELMGFPKQNVTANYGTSMFDKNHQLIRFTSGDIFGIFRPTARWTPLDLTKNYAEFTTPPVPKSQHLVKAHNSIK